MPSSRVRPITERPGALLALVLLAIAGAYSASPLGDFVWDDTTLIVEQQAVRELQPIGSYFDRMFFGGPAGAPTRTFYRPLVTLSFALDWKVWGGNPLGFHFTNLLLHLGCAALVFTLSRRWGASPIAAALVAAAFGLLPRLTEAVAWISGRTDLLASFFVLSALAVHPASRGSAGAGGRTGASLLLLLGLLSKEVAVAGVLAIALVETTSRRFPAGSGQRWWGRLVPLAGIGILYAGLRAYAELSARAPSSSPPILPVVRVLVALEALGSYAWMLVDPFRPRTQIGSIYVRSWPEISLGVLVIFGGTSWWVWQERRKACGQATGADPLRDGVRFALGALVLVPLALVLHLIPVPLNVNAADRFLYLPAAALAVGGAVASGRWAPHRRRLVGIATGVLLLPAAVATYARTLDWQGEVSLWSEAVGNAPEGNSLPFVQLGIALSRADRPEEALPALERAEAIDRSLAERGFAGIAGNGSREARAIALVALGRFDEALAIAEWQARARSADPAYRYNVAAIRAMSLDFTGAKRELDAVLSRWPDYDAARAFRASLDGIERRWSDLPVDPRSDGLTEALLRASVYMDLGRKRDAKAIWSLISSNEDADRESREEANRRLSLAR